MRGPEYLSRARGLNAVHVWPDIRGPYTPLGMKVGIPRETGVGERRVALVPDGVRRLVEAGVEVLVEQGAGAEAGILDPDYEGAGATVVPDVYPEADVI